MTTAFLILAVLLLVQSLMSLREGFVFLRLVRRSIRPPTGKYSPMATVIIPCKNVDSDFEANLSSFMNQEYPRYDLVCSVASEQDPAWSRLVELSKLKRPPAFTGLSECKLVVAGRCDVRAEKLTNLLRGLEAVSPDTEVLVFADADGRPKAGWLRALVAP